jgi:hypothetical protein
LVLTTGILLVILLSISSVSVVVEPGVLRNVPVGYFVSNLDPNLNSTSNNEIYDPNFLPGFQAGLTNLSIYWNSGMGYADLGYLIGPWAHQESTGIPHFAVGPQCCNFNEVSHTQQFRRVEWGDYYYVMAGFSAPGINVENYTTDFASPAYVGLRTDWDWKLQLSLNWKTPVMMNSGNEWGAIGVSVTQFVPTASGNLVSTLVNLWMDANSSRYVPVSADGSQRRIGSNLVTYHPVQITGQGNTTITLDITPYLEDTLHVLGFQSPQDRPAVISYVYLNVEGYNFAWNTTLWSFNLMSQKATQLSSRFFLPALLVFLDVFWLIPICWGLTRLRLSKNQS